MLIALSIHDVALARHTELSLDRGFTALSGESGAGKSIVLDALAMALGLRAERSLIRAGADCAIAAAQFRVGPEHPARILAAQSGLETAAEDDLILRRVLSGDDRRRAFLNDSPISVGLLRQIGETLCRIQSQHEALALLDGANRRRLLDRFAGIEADVAGLAARFEAWREAVRQREAATRAAAESEAARLFLDEALAEIAELAPEPDEEARLAAERAFALSHGRLSDALGEARRAFDEKGRAGGFGAVGRAIDRAQRALEGTPAAAALEAARQALGLGLAALDRAEAEWREAEGQIAAADRAIGFDHARLPAIEERLFALRQAGRKFGASGEGLARRAAEMTAERARLAASSEHETALIATAAACWRVYESQAATISAKRRKAAAELSTRITAELGALGLAAAWRAEIRPRAGDAFGVDGVDDCDFLLAANAGAPLAPLSETASGGELARIALALSVTLAERKTDAAYAPMLAFDEADQGLGGAAADAVGALFARLGARQQTLAITHSPQVAARAHHHWRASKREAQGLTISDIQWLTPEERRVEIGRMIAGAALTPEALMAAGRLMAESQIQAPAACAAA